MHAAMHVTDPKGLNSLPPNRGPRIPACNPGQVFERMASAELALHKLTRFSLLWGAGYVRNGGRLHLRFRAKHLNKKERR